MIIKRNAISNQGGLWTFRGVPYTGGALELSNGHVVGGGMYENGRYVDVYRSEFIVGEVRNSIEVERDYTGEQFYWGDSVYNGFSYEFSGDVCVSERLYEYGWVIEEVTYFPDGQLRTVEIGEDVPQSYEWFEGGGLEAMTVHQNNIFMFSLKFSLEGLTRLTLLGDYFSKLPQVIGCIRFPVLRDKAELSSLKCATRVSLIGDGIDKAVVDYIFMGDNERCIRELELDGVNGTPEILQCLKNYQQLSVLKVVAAKDCVGWWREGCVQFQVLRPECDVYLNNRKVSLEG